MSAMDGPDFAALLRRYRRRRGLTQEELAERAGLSAASISLIERAITRAPQRATVQMLSAALSLSPEEAAAFLEQARVSHGHGGAKAPDAASADGVPAANLPLPLTSLIGREPEQAALLEMIRHDAIRLLTLTGPAGVGKTRLALEVAATLHRERCQDVVFVDLIPVLEPARVLPAIAQALDVHESDSMPLREALIQALRDRTLVLALDNFEQVLPAARVVLELLIACPHVKALVTSRSALNVRGERCFPVSPLPLPDLAQTHTLEEVCRVPTVALFLDRANATSPAFSVTTLADAYLVADICERLDGLPLAIELAAARVSHFGLRQLHDRLAEPSFLGVLAEGARDLADHQRTMRSTIAWSYALLNDPEKRLFRWLGVFVGGAVADDAKAISGATDDTIMEGIAALVNASLLQWVDISGVRRYTQMMTVRAYAEERLRAEGEWEEARRRHAEYFLGLVELIIPQGADQRQDVMPRVHTEYENVRAALAWAWETAATLHGLRMAGALWRYWFSHTHFLEGLNWLERFISQAGTPTTRDEQIALAQAWTGVTAITFRLDRFERALEAAETALALRLKVGDKVQIAFATMNMGNVVHAQGDNDRAMALYEECLKLLREADNRAGMVIPLLNVGGVYFGMGKVQEALAYFQQSLALSREIGESDQARALTWNDVGEVYLILDEPNRTIEASEPSYQRFKREHDTFGVAICAFTLGRAEWRMGNTVVARAYLDEAEQSFRSLGNLNMVARVLYFRASLALTMKDRAAAQADLSCALEDLSRHAQTSEYIWHVIERSGTLARQRGDAEHAARLYAAALAHRSNTARVVDPAENEMRARDLEWLRATLGEAAFASAQAEGEALSLDDALTEVRRTLHA